LAVINWYPNSIVWVKNYNSQLACRNTNTILYPYDFYLPVFMSHTETYIPRCNARWCLVHPSDLFILMSS
jgi:hypothetical protein